MPEGEEQTGAPLMMGSEVPDHLSELSTEYGLPPWVVYGVVRCLGVEALIASGTFKIYTLIDYRGESTVVVDDVHYDVSPSRTRAVLGRIAKAYHQAESLAEQKDVLGPYILRRMGDILLFSLKGVARVPLSRRENLLFGSGVCTDPLERFRKGAGGGGPAAGWRETAEDYRFTMAGDFSYSNLLASFRRTEEEAIYELAKSVLLQLSALTRNTQWINKTGDSEIIHELSEEVYKEETSVALSGVRVVRRYIDLDKGVCLVEVSVGKGDVFLQ